MGIIYRYISPSGKSYIGKTIYDQKTRAGKDGSGYKGCTAFYNAIQKYGWDNFQYEIIESCPNELLQEKEAYYINFYNAQVPNGYNVRDESPNCRTWSKTVYQFSQKGELLKEYGSLTEAAKENKCNIASLSEVCTRRKQTCLGYVWSYNPVFPDFKKNHRNKIIYQFDEEGNLIREFETVKNAANFNKLPLHQIYACASKNKRKRVDKYIFTYEPFIDWNYYALKHKRSSTTIPNGSTLEWVEVQCSTNVDEDIV